MNLYGLTLTYLNIIRELENNEGVLSEDQEKLFDFTQEEFAAKAEEFCKIIKTLEGDNVVIDKEIARLTALKASKEALIERVEKSLAEALKLFGTKDPKKEIWRFEFSTFKISTRKSESVEILDEDEVPAEYKKAKLSGTITLDELNKIKAVVPEVKGETTFDKKAIKARLDELEAIAETAEDVPTWAQVNTKFGLTLK